MTQDMLDKGYLASTSFYASTSHSTKIIDDYIDKLSYVFDIISDCEKGKNDINKFLKGPVCQTGFKRVN